MEKLDRITFNPEVLQGQPCIRGTRLTVRRVVLAVASYADLARVKENYPSLQDEDIRQALQYAAACIEDENVAIERTHEIPA